MDTNSIKSMNDTVSVLANSAMMSKYEELARHMAEREYDKAVNCCATMLLLTSTMVLSKDSTVALDYDMVIMRALSDLQKEIDILTMGGE